MVLIAVGGHCADGGIYRQEKVIKPAAMERAVRLINDSEDEEENSTDRPGSGPDDALAAWNHVTREVKVEE